MPGVVVNTVELYAELTGQTGEPLVHGSWGDHHEWDRIVKPLSRSFRVLTYDRRGHSLSARPPGQGSVRDDVLDLSSLIEHFGLAPAHILGSSFGGAIVLRLAASRPGLFRTLLVHEPPLMGLLNGDASRGLLQSWQNKARAVLELLEKGQMEAGARQFIESVASGPGAWERLSSGLRRTLAFNAPTFLDEQRDPESRTIDLQTLADFSSPALITKGEFSEAFFPAIVEKLAKTLPMAQQRLIAGAGHVPHLTRPDAYIALVKSFIRSSRSGESGDSSTT